MLETYKEVSEVMSPTSFGIGPDNRFTRRELHAETFYNCYKRI